ncbi:hypothetical protein [Curtobacterium sp. ISL-83]|uniref:hypothetical protein n=1 Tax=Curtobacterium sp. ISL-83 TaxID=2819145 RepID=UPI001BECCA09|nr:hypothetical protein [Curtobacterium sp. ISL-83]MBT2501563.1 hypothetical protein [Curtobacterium sp. ISL-83]
MSARPSRASSVITGAFVLAGVVVLGLALRGVVQQPESDTAWVALLLGACLITWGVRFVRLPPDDDEGRTPESVLHEGSAVAPKTARPLALLTVVLAASGSYVVVRWFGQSVPAAVTTSLAFVAWRIVNWTVDRAVRRRTDRDDGSAGAAPSEG